MTTSENPGSDGDDQLPLDDLYRCLADERRRALIDRLDKHGGPVALADAAEEVLEKNGDHSIQDIPAREIKQVYTSLYHSHIPKLAEMGAVEYEQKRDVIELTDRGEQLASALTQLSRSDQAMERRSAEAVILLIEDNPGDVRLIEEAFSEANIENTLQTVTDGQAALDFIHQREAYEDAPQPDVVLLDLQLPKVDGEDVLHELKHHPELEHVPVIVLTGLNEDLIKSRDLDGDADEDAVLGKPVDPDAFIEVVRSFDQFQVSIRRDDS
jgi:CheY-like chemotaxis protein